MDPQWEKIRKAFFKAPEVPPSETFAYQVMEKIASRQAFDPASFFRWFFSTLAFMGAALFFVSVWPVHESAAFETAMLKGSPYALQDFAADADQDWAGMEAL